MAEFLCDKHIVKAAKTVTEKKSAGTLAIERHRPLMNKLSDADRRRLHRRAAELLHGNKNVGHGIELQKAGAKNGRREAGRFVPGVLIRH
jgi:hypothetical protein